MKNLEDLIQMLPNGASTIITGCEVTTNKEILFVVAKKDGKGYKKQVSFKEEGRAYITKLFGGKFAFCGRFTK